MVPRNWIADIYVNSYLYDPNLKRKKSESRAKSWFTYDTL